MDVVVQITSVLWGPCWAPFLLSNLILLPALCGVEFGEEAEEARFVGGGKGRLEREAGNFY